VGAGALAWLAGCTASPQANHLSTRTASVAAWHQLRLDAASSNGSVEVERGVGVDAVIEARFRMQTADRAARAAVSAVREPDGTLTVRPAWPDGRRLDGEGASLRIVVPGASGVRVDTSNGRVSVRGMGGQAHIDTSNGAVVVEDHDGGLWVDTSNAPVEARNVNGLVEVDTSNGPVTVERAFYGVVADTSNGPIVLQDVSGRIVADTSNGPITARLSPDAVGPVRLDSSNGTIELTVGPAFAGTLRFETSNGATYIDAPRASWNADGKYSGVVRFDAPGTLSEPSLATTSNASITIRQIGDPRR
jgi:hypothetical protein